ncbi:hypothetical protein lerEdw1_007559 [Lerista edwardsae]|nr:hypothetical protein lerEdw1_007559 [Lerista edwardsae]
MAAEAPARGSASPAPSPPPAFRVAEERSGHCAVVDGHALYVWGGYVSIEENEVYLPNDELWIYEIDSGLWLIYFGGYGCRKQNELSDAFDVHDAFWEGQIFWGWHNDVHVFDTRTQTWSQPSVKQTRMNDLHFLNLDTWCWSGKINMTGEIPRERSWHTLTPITEDKLFLFGGLSSDNAPLSDGWVYGVAANEWHQLVYLPKNRPRLWHTACLGKEGEVMVFGGSKDDLHFMDTGHCSDLLIFQTQPYSLLRLSLDCIGKNAVLLEKQISWLPSKLLEQAVDKITFWAAVNYRQGKNAEVEGQEQVNFS